MGPKVKKPFRVFEAGAGKSPLDLLRKAQRSEKQKRNREFVGVDYELTEHNLQVARIKAKIEKIPSNLRTSSGCAIRELEKVPAQSQSIVYGNLFLHQVVLQNPSAKKGIEEAKRFLLAAKKALKSNGRVVLIQHLKDRAFFEQMAKEIGFRVYSRELTLTEARKSESIFLNQIADEQGRKVAVMDQIKYASNRAQKAQEIQDLAQQRGLSNSYDLYKPVIFFLRK